MEKIVKAFESLMDWINKFFSRIKGLGYIIALVIFVIFFINHGCQRKHAEQLIEKVTGLNIKNDILLKQNKEAEKLLKEKDALIMRKNYQIDSVDAIKNKERQSAEYWKGKHNEIAKELSQITSDSIYQLCQAIYNYYGEYKYLFNEPQIRAIYATYLENENKANQIIHTTNALNECEQQLELIHESISLREDKYNIKEFQYKNLDEVLKNKESENELLRKELKKKKFWTGVKNFGIGLAFLAGLLI
jgi:hypothetical protein